MPWQKQESHADSILGLPQQTLDYNLAVEEQRNLMAEKESPRVEEKVKDPEDRRDPKLRQGLMQNHRPRDLSGEDLAGLLEKGIEPHQSAFAVAKWAA